MDGWLRRVASLEFMPHGHCYYWLPSLLWLEVITNLAIGLAYMVISITLVDLVRRVRDLPFQWVYLAFGAFIVTCGFTHFMDVWVIWRPNYWLDVGVRAVTAVASVGTAVLLLPLVPKIAAVADAARTARLRGVRLEELNHELERLYESTHEALAEAVPHLVWTAAPDGRLDHVNQRWVGYFGARPSPGARLASVVHPEEAAALGERLGAALDRGEDLLSEHRLRAADGSYRWFLLRARLVSVKDRPVKWVGTATDIQEQRLLAEERERALAQARDAVRARDVFLAVAAHELRTPLTPLRLEVESLHHAAKRRRLDRLTPEHIADRTALLSRHIARLQRLVDDLLDVSRIVGGKLELSREEVDVVDLVREVLARYAAEISRSGSAVTTTMSERVTGAFDRARLDQVITNLLSNALKYGAGKPIEIHVRDADGRVTLAVRDHGIGVSPEAQARIFDRFERAASARHYAGLGLGLWITRQMVEAHGGTVRVESTPGEGSTFTVELPLRPPA